jgi:hypothetical protein
MLDRDQLLSLDRPQPACSECGAALDEFDRHPTRLSLGDAGLRRADFCPECWEFAKTEAHDFFWLTRRERADKPAPRLSRRQKAVAARALFESLWERRDEEDVEGHLYFLAHLLLRWGGLRWVRAGGDEAGREIVVFENPATGDLLELRAVEASDDSIQQVRQNVEAFLAEYATDGGSPPAL